MKRQDRIKLDLIRIEGICRMLLEKLDHDELKHKIENVTNTSGIRDVKSALSRLSRYQLIKIIELSLDSVKSSDINNAYEQYRYGLKPGFTLFRVNGKGKKVTVTTIENKMKELLAEIKDGEMDNYKSLKYKTKTKIDENVYEFSFTYLSKYSYISENEEPKYIYELKECFAWVSLDGNFIAIKNSPNKIISILKKIFISVYDANISNIKLTKKLIKEVFNENNMKKVAFYKPTAGINEAQRIIVADPQLAEKEAVRNSLESYDITSSFLNEEIDENLSSNLGINCNQGKIYLTRNMTATIFRTWSVKRINDIINYIKQTDSSVDYDIFKAKNIMDDYIWEGYTKQQKSILEEIAYRIILNKKRNKDTDIINIETDEMYKLLGKFFYYQLNFNCDKCNDIAISFCNNCGSSNLALTKNGLILTCNNCGSQQDTTFSVQCEAGHINTFSSIQDLLVLYPTMELLKKFSVVIKNNFDIDLSVLEESFYIQSGNIVFLKQSKGKYIQPDKIAELDFITSEQIFEDEYDKLISMYDGIKEKCKNSSNKKCNRCLLSEKNICIMKLFSVCKGYRPSPHQSMEFGDVNFTVTYEGEEIELVGIAKSRIAGQEVLNLSGNTSGDIIKQFLAKTRDKRVGITAIICPMRFHDQLKQELIYISKITNTKLTIFDDEFMVKLLKYYNKTKLKIDIA